MEKNRAIGIAAERAAGRLRAMEWTDWQRMLLGLEHGVVMIAYTNGKLAESGDMESLAQINVLEADMQAMLTALEILGLEQNAELFLRRQMETSREKGARRN